MLNSLRCALFVMITAATLSLQAAPEISCRPREMIADGGHFVTIEKKGKAFKYTFTAGSFAGPKVLRQKDVDFQVIKGRVTCRIQVVEKMAQKGKKTEMFYLQRTRKDGAWELESVPGMTAPDLACEVDAALAQRLCEETPETR